MIRFKPNLLEKDHSSNLLNVGLETTGTSLKQSRNVVNITTAPLGVPNEMQTELGLRVCTVL